METATEGRVVMIKLSDGEDVFLGLEAACRDRRIQSGAIHWGIGMLQDFEIGFFGPAGYEKRTLPDRHELIAFHGSITVASEPKFHIHVAVAGRDHTVLGGHLFRAKAAIVNEICVERFDSLRMSRRSNPGTGLNELHLE